MKIRKSISSDINDILIIYERARSFMKETGNPNQWKDNKPEKEEILKDINDGNHYIVYDDDGIYGAFSFIIGIDPTYNYIEGAWLNNENYGTLHKVASAQTKHGILSFILGYCSALVDNIRIDTHEDNKVMQHLILKNGFTKCGIIYLLNGEARIAYQKKIR